MRQLVAQESSPLKHPQGRQRLYPTSRVQHTMVTQSKFNLHVYPFHILSYHTRFALCPS